MTPVEVGIYAAGASLISVIAFVPSSFSYLALPTFAQINDEDGIRRYQDEYKRISTYIFEFGLPLSVALILLAHETLNLLYGFGYIQAKIAMVILSVGMFLRCILGPAEDLLISVAITKPIMSSTVFGGLLNILLNFILIPVMGIQGAALATCSSILFIKMWAFVVAYRQFRINPFNYKQLQWTAICLCIAIPVWYFKVFFAQSLDPTVYVPAMYILFLFMASIAWYFIFRRFDKNIFR
jgi:O-antigen/teichoic acid export membrane protein